MTNQSPQQATNLSNEDKMARGSAWLTIGNIGSRLIGIIYILPWYYWLGDNAKTANGLFNMSYTVYSIFIMISTAGLPSAIAKQVAYHNSRKEYRTSQKIFERALQLMVVLGGVFAVIMYVSAPLLARGSRGGDDLIPSMRSLSLAILVIPVMSVIRGYFQGIQDVAPYAISQLVEQLVRVVYILGSTFIIMNLGSGDYVKAVTQSTFAAFVGAIASVIVLLYYFRKEKVRMDVLAEVSSETVEIDTVQLMLSTIKEAIPFIILGSGITIYKLADQFTFARTMQTFTQYSEKQLVGLLTLFSGNPDKLTMIVIGLATAMASVGLPLITEAFAKNDRNELAKLISNHLQLYAFIMIPASLGMALLAYPLNTLVYSPDRLGANLLIVVCLSGLVLGLFMVTSTMLQGMYENKAAIVFFLIGFLVKLLFQTISIHMLEAYGPLLSTVLGMSVTCYLNLRKLHKKTHFNSQLTFRRIILIVLMSLIMMIFVGVTRGVLGIFLSADRKGQSFMIVLLVAAVGVAVYLYMGLKTRLADKLLGSQMAGLRKKLHIK